MAKMRTIEDGRLVADYDSLQVGDGVYYTGDMANQDGFGEVTKRDENPRWGLSYDIGLYDGRTMRGIRPAMFHGAGRRFREIVEYESERNHWARVAEYNLCRILGKPVEFTSLQSLHLKH